jgi:phage terminase large subunit-like protein
MAVAYRSKLGHSLQGRCRERLERLHHLAHGSGQFYLLEVDRGRFDYPQLKQCALLLADRHRPDSILAEDAGTGSTLVQELRQVGRSAIGVRPEGDKIARMSVETA